MINETTRKTAFVFAGGGSFGAIQVGILRGLVAYGLRPDFVIGSSVGAILASCAIPAIFPPILSNDNYLVDGAIASNTPVMAAVDLGATTLIVLPTGYACALAALRPHVVTDRTHASKRKAGCLWMLC